MRKAYLWVDRRGADLQWPGQGNVNVGTGAKGTLALWVQPRGGSLGFWNDERLWRIYISSTNYLASRYGRGVMVVSGGTTYQLGPDSIDRGNVSGWEVEFVQWDFTQGTVRSYYNDGRPAQAALTGIPALPGTPQWITVGYPYSDPVVWAQDHLLVQGMAIWDGLLTTAR